MAKQSFFEIIKSKLKERHFEESLLFISVGILASLVCSGYAVLFSNVEAVSINFFNSNKIASFFISPLCLLISFISVQRLAPGSSGSGIPQVMTCIENSNSSLANVFLRKSVIVIKMFSSLIAVFAGAAIGREGPSLQISSAIAYNMGILSKRVGLKVKLDQLLIAGAASGLAAAFNTPIGGIVYAIEELSKEHVRTFRDVLLLSVVISGLTAQLVNGNYLYLGYPSVLKSYAFSTLAVVAVCGIITGVLGASFSKALIHLGRWRAGKSLKTQFMIILGTGVVIAAVFHSVGPKGLYSGKESINHVLFSTSSLSFYEVLSRIFMPLLSSMTGIAGGIFAPSLSAGAILGGWVADFIDPSIRNILALCGMIGFLTGVSRTPITALVLVLEMTDRHSAVFPMMISAVVASIGAHFISEKSFYEESVLQIKNQFKKVE